MKSWSKDIASSEDRSCDQDDEGEMGRITLLLVLLVKMDPVDAIEPKRRKIEKGVLEKKTRGPRNSQTTNEPMMRHVRG